MRLMIKETIRGLKKVMQKHFELSTKVILAKIVRFFFFISTIIIRLHQKVEVLETFNSKENGSLKNDKEDLRSLKIRQVYFMLSIS